MSNGVDLSISRSTPVVDFTSQDFDSINDDLTTYAQATFSAIWTDFNADQFAVVMKELIAYVGDLTSYMINSVIRECFAATVIRRQNLINIGKTFDYTLDPAVPATVVIQATLDPAGTYPATIAQTDQYSNGASGDAEVIFHPTNPVTVSSYPAGGKQNISCTEGEYYASILIGVSDGTPNQQWQFPQQGIYTPSIIVVVGIATWTATKNFTLNQSTDTVFKIVQNDDGNTYALFGDGIFGAIPPNNAQIYATFNVGGGSQGNVPAGVIDTKVNANAVILSVTNLAASSNGSPEESMKQGRNGIPASLSTLDRGVTTGDYQALAILVPGVAKAKSASGVPIGARIIRLWIAPDGGGAPTPVLLTSVSSTLAAVKMVTNRIQLYSPFYKNVFLNVLLHVNNSFRALDVQQATLAGLISPDNDGSGLLDFNNLDFGAVSVDANGNTELLLTQTRLQAYFGGLNVSGLDRAEIQTMTVDAVPRAPDTGNTGNGTLTSITLTTKQRRRQYYVKLISSAQYAVYERLVGQVSLLTDTVMTDSNEIFDNEGIASYTGYQLAPDATSSNTVLVAGATGSDVTTNTTMSLFTMTSVGSSYYLFNPTPVICTIGGTPFVSSDGNVTFTVTPGSTPFVGGDSFTLDVYPLVGDIQMAQDEYPSIVAANITLRTSGGSLV